MIGALLEIWLGAVVGVGAGWAAGYAKGHNAGARQARAEPKRVNFVDEYYAEAQRARFRPETHGQDGHICASGCLPKPSG